MFIAGYDITYSTQSSQAIACASVFSKDGELVEEIHAIFEPEVEYIPGRLYLREQKGLDLLLPRLEHGIEFLVIDGNGTIHPKKYGAACTYAERFDLKTAGCAKKLLVGEYEEPDREAGSRSPIHYEGEIVGYALRSATDVNPVFVSTGCPDTVSQDEAVDLVYSFCRGFRIPEITRRPDIRSRELMRELEE